MIPDCTLTTACFDLTQYSSNSRPLETAIQNMDTLLQIPCFLVIFCDSITISSIKKLRNDTYNLGDLTYYIEQKFEDIWTYKYVDQVRQNRSIFFPTETHRSSVEKHLICCNKFDFVLQTIEINPFNTTNFGWIDSSIGENAKIICENYEKNMLLYILNNITYKFHIQILNVCDKKYKSNAHKNEYYSQYRWVVCGGLFTTSGDIGIVILNRLKNIFIETTKMGLGHNEEMLYLEILDEFYFYIEKSYGDYKHILNNFIKPTKGFQYIDNYIVDKYLNNGYYQEGFDCCKKILNEFDNFSVWVDYSCYFSFLFKYYLFSLYLNNTKTEFIRKRIFDLIEKHPCIKTEYEKSEQYYFSQLVKNNN